jgi:hypothetical protein
MSSTFTRDPKPRIQYVADGSRTTFAFPFVVEASDDLLVYADDHLATGFAIDGLGDPSGGEIVFGSAPSAGAVLTLLRRTESIRETAFKDGGPFRAAAINAELDRIMMLIQEDRDAHDRALRVGPTEAGLELCLPAPSQRANSVFGFDSSGMPTIFGQADLPDNGDASGAAVTAAGGITARALGEHLASAVNVRDFGAIGDGTTDDAAAVGAAVAAAAARKALIYVPASAGAYVLASGITLTGLRMVGDGPGSLLKLAPASGFGIQLAGSGAGLAGLRLLGPGASSWPEAASEVELSGISLDGIRIAAGALAGRVFRVEVAACRTAVAVEGDLAALIECDLAFGKNGIELRAGASGALSGSHNRIRSCTSGLRIDGAAPAGQLALHGGRIEACGFGLDGQAPAAGWRSIDLAGLAFRQNLDADVRASARHAVAMRGCSVDSSGRRQNAQVVLTAGGATTEAPSLVSESVSAATVERATVVLSGGSNLNLLQQGDLIVLGTDADDIDDVWTAAKATRAGLVQSVTTQTTTTATIRVARALATALISAGDQVRIVGRSGVASVDSVGGMIPANTPKWVSAEDHCRVFAAGNPVPEAGVVLGGASARLDHVPGLGGEPARIGGVELDHGRVNGAFSRLLTFEIAQNAAISFTPDSTIGMVQAFAQSLALGDPIAAVFSYRADSLGYTQLLCRGIA